MLRLSKTVICLVFYFEARSFIGRLFSGLVHPAVSRPKLISTYSWWAMRTKSSQKEIRSSFCSEECATQRLYRAYLFTFTIIIRSRKQIPHSCLTTTIISIVIRHSDLTTRSTFSSLQLECGRIELWASSNDSLPILNLENQSNICEFIASSSYVKGVRLCFTQRKAN